MEIGEVRMKYNLTLLHILLHFPHIRVLRILLEEERLEGAGKAISYSVEEQKPPLEAKYRFIGITWAVLLLC